MKTPPLSRSLYLNLGSSRCEVTSPNMQLTVANNISPVWRPTVYSAQYWTVITVELWILAFSSRDSLVMDRDLFVSFHIKQNKMLGTYWSTRFYKCVFCPVGRGLHCLLTSKTLGTNCLVLAEFILILGER
ncbi:hypothetical protein ILYODFUR_029281 [Ilyodon furcidens]|uniref:Uncharacterized protein n=1 Tax=Ilyodon furcidens TaxID=33524 RepID=A0ABV0TFY2_9TELE